jgi:hypothetical protein
MATNAEIARNNLLRQQALARAQVLRREALRGLWEGAEAAVRRLATVRLGRTSPSVPAV